MFHPQKVVSAEKLLSATIEWAKELASKPGFAAGLTKNIIQYASDMDLGATIEYEARIQQFCRVSDDYNEGREAFLTKRKPQFTGKKVDIPRGVMHFAKL